MQHAKILHEIDSSGSLVWQNGSHIQKMSCTLFTGEELSTNVEKIAFLSYNRFKKTLILNVNSSSKSTGRVAEIMCKRVHPARPNSSLVIPLVNFFSNLIFY